MGAQPTEGSSKLPWLPLYKPTPAWLLPCDLPGRGGTEPTGSLCRLDGDSLELCSDDLPGAGADGNGASLFAASVGPAGGMRWTWSQLLRTLAGVGT